MMGTIRHHRLRGACALCCILLGCRSEDRAASARVQATTQSAELPPLPEPPATPTLIDALYDVDQADAAVAELEAMGPAALPLLLRALDDPRTKTARYPERPRYLPQVPLQRICELLKPHAPLEDRPRRPRLR